MFLQVSACLQKVYESATIPREADACVSRSRQTYEYAYIMELDKKKKTTRCSSKTARLQITWCWLVSYAVQGSWTSTVYFHLWLVSDPADGPGGLVLFPHAL